MSNINVQELINATDRLILKTTSVENMHHSSSYWFDKLMRWFEKEPSCTSVTLSVFLNAPIMKNGTVTIGRDGTIIFKVKEA